MIIIRTQFCIFIVESLHFETDKLLKLGVNYNWYHVHMAQNAEPTPLLGLV